jgi:hypothetical protein
MGWAEISAHPILLVGWRSPGVSFHFRLNGFAYVMRVVRIVIAVVALLAVGTAPASGSVPASTSAPTKAKPSNITFGAGPANTKAPDGRTIFAFNASAGGSIESHIAVLNLTRHREVLRVYTVDVSSGTDGGYVYAARSAPRLGAGSWVTVGTPHEAGFIKAAPRSTTILPVHLSVPTNASPGDHAAAVIVSLTGLVKGKSGQLVDLEQRVATRVLIRVSGTLRPQLSIENLRASYASRLNPIPGGPVTVRYTVTNTGNAVLSGTQQVSIHGMLGTTVHAKGLPAIPTLLPGGSFVVTAHLPDVFPELRMTANVQVTPVGLASDADPGLSVVTASTHVWAIPWLVIGVLILLLLLGIWRYRRWRRPTHQAITAIRSTTPQGAPAP